MQTEPPATTVETTARDHFNTLFASLELSKAKWRQQTAVGRAGAGKGSAGRLPGASATRACCAAATAERPRGAGSAVKGPGTTSHGRGGSGLRQPLPDLADADVVFTAVKTASRAPSAVALASLGPVLTAIARDAPTTLRSGRRNDVSIEQRNCNLQFGESRGGTRLAVSLVGSASNGDVIFYFAHRVSFQPCADICCTRNHRDDTPVQS